MIRLSPPQHGRIEFAPMLEAWVGGGESTSPTALSRLGLRTALGRSLNSSRWAPSSATTPASVGMDTSYVVERKYDGVGKKDRHRLNFTEVGVATARLGHPLRPRPYRHQRDEAGRRQLEETLQRGRRPLAPYRGIYAALSEGTRQVVAEAVKAAHEAGTIVSYDLKFPLQALEHRRGSRRPPSRWFR